MGSPHDNLLRSCGVSVGVTRRKVLGRVVVLLAFIAVGFLAALQPMSASAASSSGPVVRTGPVSLTGCPGATLMGRAMVSKESYALGHAIRIQIVIRNVGKTTCDYDGFASSRTQEIGLCGAISLVVRNAAGTDVYPGGLVASCPMETGVPLRPDGSLIAQG